MNITSNGSVAAQPFTAAPNPGDIYTYVVAVQSKVLAAAVVGSLNIVCRWSDPDLGAMAHTTNILLTLVNGMKEETFPITVSDASLITAEATVVGLIGSTSYSADISAARTY